VAKLDVLEEKVTNHIKFFWVVVAFGFLWLGALTALVIKTKTTVTGIAEVEANIPAQIVTSLLRNPAATSSEVQANLAAAASVLKATKVGSTQPNPVKLEAVYDQLVEDQSRYADLPQVWETTGVFINYKSEVFLSPDSNTAQIASGKQCKLSMDIPSKPITYRNCEISLEDAAHEFINVRVNGQHVPMVFVNCIVHYHGGDLPDTRVLFYGSIFRFDVLIVPSQNGRQAMRELAGARSFNGLAINGATQS
jgi:hypothetical protein